METININVPEGTKEATLKVADKEGILHFDSEEFKVGDIIVSENKESKRRIMALINCINSSVYSKVFVCKDNAHPDNFLRRYSSSLPIDFISEFRLATPKERGYFIETLVKQGYTLNSNSNLIKKRWIANLCGSYFFITLDEEEGLIIEDSEDNVSIDDYRFSINNYFKTKAEAQVKLDKILSILKED